MTNKLTHLSYSSISHYLDCPRSWKHKYIDGLPTAGSEAMAFGSLCHKAIELYLITEKIPLYALYKNAIQSKNIKTPIRPISDEKLDEIDEQARFFCEEIGQELLEYGEGFFGDDLTTVLDEIEVKAIEHMTSFNVTGVDVPVIGFVDCLTTDGVIIDFKTSSRSWNQSKADEQLQMSFYAASLLAEGHITLPVTCKYVVLVKNKMPKIQVLETVRTAADVFRVHNLARSVWNSIKAGAFHENPTGWRCSEKYCDFWENCQGGLINEKTDN